MDLESLRSNSRGYVNWNIERDKKKKEKETETIKHDLIV